MGNSAQVIRTISRKPEEVIEDKKVDVVAVDSAVVVEAFDVMVVTLMWKMVMDGECPKYIELKAAVPAASFPHENGMSWYCTLAWDHLRWNYPVMSI